MRLTSSSFGTICKLTEKRDIDKLLTNLLCYKTISTASILHGKKYENIAVEAYEHTNGIKTSECGLFVCTCHPYLASSPDRVTFEKCIEVKCPYSSKDKEINPVTVPYLYYDSNNELKLNKNHDYYFQIQGQLLCTNLDKCDLVVYTFKDMKTISVHKDNDFIDSMIKKLQCFYTNHYKNALIEKFVYKNYFDHFF